MPGLFIVPKYFSYIQSKLIYLHMEAVISQKESKISIFLLINTYYFNKAFAFMLTCLLKILAITGCCFFALV